MPKKTKRITRGERRDQFAALPRVYLDTAVLVMIADGKVDDAALAELRAVMEQARAVLLISAGHQADIHRRTDPETRRRVRAVIEKFPRTAFVMSNPWRDERQALVPMVSDRERPPSDGPLVDIRISRVTSWPDNRFTSAAYSGTGELFTSAVDAQRQFQRRRADAPLTDADVEKQVTQLLAICARKPPREIAELILGPDADPVEFHRTEAQILADWARVEMISMSVAEYARRHGVTDEEMIRAGIKEPAVHAVGQSWIGVRGGFTRWSEAARVVAPGLFLVAALARNNAANVRRPPDYGDPVDHFHVAVIPYVDVATADRHNWSVLHPVLPKVRVLRPCILIANPDRRLRTLIDAVALLKA